MEARVIFAFLLGFFVAVGFHYYDKIQKPTVSYAAYEEVKDENIKLKAELNSLRYSKQPVMIMPY